LCPKSSPPQRLSSKTMTLPPTLSKNCLFEACSSPSTDERDAIADSASPLVEGMSWGRLCDDPRGDVIRGRANFPSERSLGVGRGDAREELGSESAGSKNPRRVLGSTLDNSPCVNATISASAPVEAISISQVTGWKQRLRTLIDGSVDLSGSPHAFICASHRRIDGRLWLVFDLVPRHVEHEIYGSRQLRADVYESEDSPPDISGPWPSSPAAPK
jgi:hypothetical protein